MTYVSVFGGNTIYPSDVSFLPIALNVDTPLEWPLESSGLEDPAARIIEVTPAASGYSIVLPDATLTGAGQTILFNNIDGANSFYVKDFAGNTLATIAFGEQWQVYLAAVTTAAGTWRVFRYGASTATVQPSALAGYGLTVTSSTLSQSLPVTTFSTSGTTVAVSSRASALVWNGTGAGTLNLLTAALAGNNFFVFVRNEGGGDLTIDPSGTETINSAVNLVLRPGDSATLITDGTTWYTIGLGQQAVFAFDYTSISVTGGDYTLSGSELNRIAYKFVGTLTSDLHVIVPSTVQQYWINNATTGAFNFFIQTASGTPTQVNQGAKGIYYCDGTNMVLGSDPTSLTTPIVVSDGGTGATTASAARLNLGVTLFADPIVTATTGASVRTTIGAAASGANTDITSITGSAATLTTPRTLTIGSTGKTFNGSANVTWTLSEIGAAASGANTDITSLEQDVTIAATGTIAADSIGFRGLPQNAQTGAYTLALSDAGKQVSNTTGGFVIPANGSVAFPVGTAIVLYNNSGSNQTISITSDTLRQAGTANTGTRTLAQYGVATVVKVASTTWVVTGSVS